MAFSFSTWKQALTARHEIGARRQFVFLYVLFTVILTVYSTLIIRDQLETIALISELKNDTVPLMVERLRTARSFDTLRFEADKAIHAETEDRSAQGLYYVSVHASSPEFVNDPVMGALAAKLSWLLQDFEYAQRGALIAPWSSLSEQMAQAADQMSFEGVALGNKSIAAVDEDLSDSLRSSIWTLLLGILLQSLTLLYIAVVFVDPLKKLGKYLYRLEGNATQEAIHLPSHTREIKSIERAVNQLSTTLQQNRQVTEDLRQSELLLKQEMVAAQEATRTKSEFISNISHEIRTPLCAITGMVYVLERSGLTPHQAKRLELINQCSTHLNELITRVLDLSKIEAHMLTLENRAFTLGPLFDECHALFATQAAEKHLAYSLHIPAHVRSLQLRGDPLRIKEIAINLLSNAIKFTSVGQVVVQVELLERGAAQNVNIKITVTDTGIGLSPEQMGQLFQNFSQGDSSTSRRYGGTGLGLSISQKLAHLMSGTLGAESLPGKGSTFWCTLWVSLGRAAPSGTAAAIAADAADAAPMAAPEATRGEASVAMPLVLTPLLPTPPPLHAAPTTAGVTPLCQQLAWLAASNDPAALAMLEAHWGDFEQGLGAALPAIKRALEQYRLPEATALLAATGCAPTQPPPSPRLEQDDRPVLLLVDDNPSNLTYLASLLEEVYRLRVATSGPRAIALATSHPPPDVVLMDIAMPDMDGLTTLRAMKAYPAAQGIPVVLITASHSREIHAQAVRWGAIGVIDRATTPTQLQRTVADALIKIE